MGHRELTVIDVGEILRRYVAGETVRAITRATGTDRKTVRGYLRAAEELGLVRGGAPATPAQVAAIGHSRRPPREAHPGERDRALLAHSDRIRAWLFKDRLRLTKVAELLAREGLVVPYTTLRRFARAYCDFGQRTLTVRLADPPPGHEAQVDFGRLGLLWHPESERRRLAYAFVLVLSYSRHQFVDVVFDQTIPTVIACFEKAWAYLGGVVAYAIPDNIKAIVTKADLYHPTFHPAFLEYAAYRGFLVDPARPADPTGKARVERPVPYVRESFFRGETFLDFDDCRRRAIAWCTDVAGRRIHGTTRRRPLIVFEEEEKAHLGPLSAEPFDVPAWGTCKVHPDHHVRFLQSLYSVPTRYVGSEVTVRADSRLVRIYQGTELIKTHARQAPGKRSTDYSDYPQQLTPYALRDPDYYTEKALKKGEQIGRFMEALLDGPFPWAKLRLAQKLLRLAETYGSRRLDAACARALGFELIDVFRVETILKKALDQETPPSTAAAVTPLPSRFARSPRSFVHSHQEVPNGSHSRTQEAPQKAAPERRPRHPARPRRPRDPRQALLPGVLGADPLR